MVRKDEPGFHEPGRAACDQSAFAGSDCSDEYRCDNAMGIIVRHSDENISLSLTSIKPICGSPPPVRYHHGYMR